MTASSFTVLGAGSWGTALALLLARNGHTVRIWSKDHLDVTAMEKARENKRYLPGFSFPALLTATHSLEEALDEKGETLIAVPSHAFREVIQKIAPYLHPQQGISWASKGLDQSARFLHEVISEELGPRPMALLTGPSFAKEVAEGLPTAVVLASNNANYAKKLQPAYQNPHFRVYLGEDLIGAELGGAVKNVLALAVGIADGLGFRTNTKAALMTRGLAEMMRLGEALGAKRETLTGLSGLGDLILTCSDTQSRNLRFGMMLGQGLSPEAACAQIGQVVESIHTSKLVHMLAEKHQLRMPISAQVFAILHDHISCETAMARIMQGHTQQE